MAKNQPDSEGTTQRKPRQKATTSEIPDTPRFTDVTEQKRLNEAA